MSPDVVDVHRNHLQSHRFVQEYASGFEYLRDELGFSESEIASDYRNVGMEQMYRIHTDEPRPFLILQKNPNLKSNWISGSVHGPHTHLSNWSDDGLARNISHSRTTVANYLKDKGGLKLKVILESLADVFNNFDYGFESALDQEEFCKYLRTEIGEDYSNSAESTVIGSEEGFFGDFAYSNVMKFQGPAGEVSVKQDDREWLKDELAAIDPQVILALGNPAKHSLKELGFERTDYSGPFSDDEGKVYRYGGPDSRLEGMYVLRLYHLQSRTSIPHEILHQSLRTIEPKLQSPI